MDQGRLWTSTFRERFCEQYNCEESEFEERVFWRCLHYHAYPLAGWALRKFPGFFREDIEFIHEIGGVRDPLIFKSEVNRFHGRNVREKSWLRGSLHIRVSAKRVINLKNRIFGLSS